MKKFLLIGSLIFLAGCASQKPLAVNVIQLAGNKKVVGWDTPDNIQKPKIIVKKVYKEWPDSDKDGVPDNIDKCPNTPKDVTVNHFGCPIISTLRLNFDFNKWKIKKIYYPELSKIAKILKANYKLKIEIDGYTDNIGNKKYNLELSKKRAESVKDVLVKTYGISSRRIKIKGFGEAYPLVPNTTHTNKAINRRVEIVAVN